MAELPNRSEEMLKYVPGYYRGSKYYQAQNTAKGREFDIMRAIMDDLPNQLVPQKATWGLVLWEEFLEITPAPGESLVSRRMNVMKKYSNVQLVTPISMERMIWAMANARVDIIRNVAPYTFKVQIKEESLDSNIAAIREVLEEFKEAHMAYVLAVFLGTVRTGERFVPRVTNRMSVYWYRDWILNGEYDLNGEQLLNAVFPPFYRVINRLRAKSKERFLNVKAGNTMRFELEEQFLAAVRNGFTFYWWENGKHLLNGRYILDGSYLLDTEFPPYDTRSIHTLNLPVYEAVDVKAVNNRAGIINRPHANIRSVYRAFFCWWGDKEKVLNGKYDLDGVENLDKVLSEYECKTSHLATMRIDEGVEASVTIKNNLWYLDGTYNLDGSNKLNAYEIKEEL